MKKLIALLLAVLMLASVLAACGEKGGQTSGDAADPFYGEDNITLLVWSADKAVDLTKELCEEFKKEYPDKTINIEVQVQGEDAAATQALNDIDAAADVFSFASDQMNRLYKGDALAPLFKHEGVFDPQDVIDRNSEGSVAAATIDGELYAFPETGDNGYYLVYDKSCVTDEDAKTIEGIFAACKKANKKFVIDAGNGFFACMFPFTGGLKIDGVDDEGTQKFNDYNESDVVDTLAAFSALFNEYKDIFVSGEATRISSGMSENPSTVAAGVDGSWNTNAVKDALGDNFGAAKLPTINVNGEDKQIISLHGYKYIGVKSTTKYPYCAQALANFLTSKEAQLKRAEVLGWGPSNNEAVTDPVVTGNIALTAIIEQAKNSVPQTGISETFWTPMGALGNYLWKNNGSKDQIKAEFEKTIENIKDE